MATIRFRGHLDETAQYNLGTGLTVDIHEASAAVAAATETAQRTIEEREEVEIAHLLLDGSPKGMAWSVAHTLEALQVRRAMPLAVDDAFSALAAQCGTWKAPLPAIVSECTYCDSAKFKSVEEVVELAVEAALQQRARWGQQLLARRAQVASLCRW